jgi:hypothetical protein
MSLSGSVGIDVTPKGTGTWDTEIVAMSLTGTASNPVVGDVSVRLLPSPGLPSPGQVTLTQVGGSRY